MEATVDETEINSLYMQYGFFINFHLRTNILSSRPRWSSGYVFAIRPKVRGFVPSEHDGYLRAITIRSTTFL
jgi:hypothetical protein